MLEQPQLLRDRRPPISSMPFDKQQNGKPFTPTLSSNFRHTKSPLTPRIAGSAPNSPASGPRREVFVRTRSPAREETNGASISGNITPRSAARKSRIGTESPATPASNRDANVSRPRAKSNAAVKPSPPPQNGLGIAAAAVTSPQVKLAQSQIKSSTPVHIVPRHISGARSAVHDDGAGKTKFFRADDAKSYLTSPDLSEKPPTNPNNTQFFFVGGPQPEDIASPKLLPAKETNGIGEDRFFHASEIRSPPGSRASPRPAVQAKSSAVSLTSTRSQPNERQRPGTSASRGNSPHKAGLRIAHNGSVPQPSSPQRTPFNRLAQAPISLAANVDRRSSIGSNLSSSSKTSRQGGHRKSASTSSLTGTPTHKVSILRSEPAPLMDAGMSTSPSHSTNSIDRDRMPLLSPDTISPRRTSLSSSNTVGTTMTSGYENLDPPIAISKRPIDAAMACLPSPTLEASVSSPSKNEPPRSVNDEAANARRERKVLDLEISNSSLLAINKTLEREMRKQSIELRRFRRLSRSGRLSIAPTERTVSGSTLDTVAELDDEEEAESEQEDSDLDIDDEDILSNDSSSVQSPTSRNRQRARDEKRLMHDLSKHQQMLIDSQMLTQSIRRCTTCTEELIREGNKALEYRVGIGDVKLGGRVLNTEELDEKALDDGNERAQRQGLLSPSMATTELTGADLWASSNGTGTSTPAEPAMLDAGVERLLNELFEA